MIIGSLIQGAITIINIYIQKNTPTKIYEAKPERIIGRNRQCNSNSWVLHMPYSVMDRTRLKKPTNRRLEYHYKSTRMNRHL